MGRQTNHPQLCSTPLVKTSCHRRFFSYSVSLIYCEVLHTFFVNWAVRTFAKLDLSVAHQDQLTQLGAFGVLLTGVIFILVSIEAAQLSKYFLLTIPCGYVVGAIGMRTSGVKAQSAFYGRYFMMVYLGVCLVTFVLSRLHPWHQMQCHRLPLTAELNLQRRNNGSVRFGRGPAARILQRRRR